MAVSLKHTTQAVGTDAGNGEIRKAQWNEEHTLTAAADTLLGAVTTGAVTEITCTAAGRALLDDADASAQRTTLAAAGTGVTNTFSANQIISVTDNTNAALRITQLGTGEAIRVEDSTNPDASPFVVTAAGDVGIGTSSPSYKLDVNGGGAGDVAARFYGALIWSGSGGTNSFIEGDVAIDTLRLGTRNTERMRITSAGNVGIGTSSPSYKLDVNGGGAGGVAARFYGPLIWSGSGGTNSFIEGDAAIDTLRLGTQNTERMRIDSSGNVGIGTSSITAGVKLDVNGSMAISAATTEGRILDIGAGRTGSGFSGVDLIADASYTDYGLRLLREGGANGAGYIAHRGTGSFEVIAIEAAPVSIKTSNVERLRIDASGNVLVTSTGGLGYGTGSGGAVTQATSRTTGVTLNKTNGAITLVSAAGSATWQSFTVTNSTVAATDTVIVSQKSGTDLYQAFVTNVAAGSFRISFATTGGTTTEQPVFNFSVIKAVTA